MDAIFKSEKVVTVGGKEILTHKVIAEKAFEVLGMQPRITYIPDWIRRFLLHAARVFMSKAAYGPTEFFLEVMAMDMATDQYGQHTIKEFFKTLKDKKP